MQGTNFAWRRVALAVAALALVAGLAACKIGVKDDGEGHAKKVDIETPAGSLHVRETSDISETGLALYPGATKTAEGDEKHGANVSLEGPEGQGLRIIAMEFRSTDSPEKVGSFYRDQLKKYGEVTVCKGDLNFEGPPDKKNAVCRPNNSGEISYAAGSGEDNQRIVAVKPEGSGSKFGVVYLRVHPEKGTI